VRALIGESWLYASGAIIAVGFLADSAVLLLLGMLLLGTGAVSRLWSRVALEEVSYTRSLSEGRVFVGEQVDLRLRLVNGKVIPVPWIELRDQLPRDLPVRGGRTHPSGIPGVSFLIRDTSLGSREHVDWPLSLHPAQRGYYRLGPARMRAGDLFGFFEREVDVPGWQSLTVYPRTVALTDLGIPGRRPFGEQRGGSRLFEDPSRVIGVRDYQPGDPLKRVDWNATARTGRLQSRLYEPSRTQATVIALNITTMERSWQGFDPILLERSVAVAASVAVHEADAGAAVGLIANGSFPDADRPIRLGASNNPDQLMRVLEALAIVAPFTTSTLSSELESHTHPLPTGATIVVVAALLPGDLVATLARLQSEGHGVYVLKTSDREWEHPLGSIPVHDAEPYLRELEAKMQAEVVESAS